MFQLLWDATNQPGGQDVLESKQVAKSNFTEVQVGVCALSSRCTVKIKTYLFKTKGLEHALLPRPISYLCNSPVTSESPADSSANFKATL